MSELLAFEPGTGSIIACARIMLALALAINLMGTKSLAMAALVGFTAELLGALAVGTWLLITERYHNLSVLFDTEGVGAGGSYFSAFVAAALIGIHQYYGFEACGDVAEEVPDPTRQIPMVMRMTIHVGGAAAIFVLGSVYSTKALTSIISFATLGIHPGFQMVVFAALRARLKGWQPNGAVRLGRWGMPVTIAALTYGVLAMVNMASPRTPRRRGATTGWSPSRRLRVPASGQSTSPPPGPTTAVTPPPATPSRIRPGPPVRSRSRSPGYRSGWRPGQARLRRGHPKVAPSQH